jgi:hypothetical protein
MDVQILEKSTDRHIGIVPVPIDGALEQDGECFDEAWYFAVEDGIVDADERDKYHFRIVKS